ncbi:MAG: hypothetical protein R3F30_08180 [Planctomycetota bacterium]
MDHILELVRRARRRARKRLRVLRECPHCGASYYSGVAACPECGSDENTGWKPTAEIHRASVDLGDDDAPGRSSRARVLILVVAALFAAVYAFGGCSLLAAPRQAEAR